MKPVELMERSIRNSSRPGDVVLDCFGGSGSTLIAAEKAGRRCFTMELDPKYCDVIIRRWQEFSGGNAISGDGQRVFDEVTAQEAPA
jgi:DNA modification methylase